MNILRVNGSFYKIKVYPEGISSPVIGCGKTKEAALHYLILHLRKTRDSINALIAIAEHDLRNLQNGK